MAIQKLEPPTIEEIQNTIRSFEDLYGGSDDFEAGVGADTIPEADATDWHYALQQRRALQHAARQYWKTVLELHQTERCTGKTWEEAFADAEKEPSNVFRRVK